jgi:pimeloyl-ACP methyl ester carboxylesterase
MANALTVETRNGSYAVEVRGNSGAELVFLHGAVANLRAWDLVIFHLQRPFRTVCVDLPAHGQTETEELRFPSVASDLREIVDRLELEQPILVGHSFGALTALITVASYPGRFSGLVVVDPYLSNAEVRGRHEVVTQALLEAGRRDWPWKAVDDIDTDIELAIKTLYSPSIESSALAAILRRGYRPQADGRFLRYPRKEDNLKMIEANWAIDLDAAFAEASCRIAIAIATITATGAGAPTLLERRRRALEGIRGRTQQLDTTEFACGHDVVGLQPIELAAYISDWSNAKHVPPRSGSA